MKKVYFLIIFFVIFLIWENNIITVSNFNYSNSKIPEDFNDFKIVQISDLHNRLFGEKQSYLVKKIEDLNPDIIVITGDLIDRRKFDLNIAMEFIEKAVKIAPTYYVSGNHEAWSGEYFKIKESLIKNNVFIMDDSADYIFRKNSKIQIIGLQDPDFLTSSYAEGTKIEKLESKIHELSQDDNFKVLLSHRPELFDIYSKNNIDIIFSGHAHGGQFRIPFIGGIVAPDQGLFPKYTSGQYNEGNSSMFVSRGIGNSIIPVRIFNPPEIISVTLKTIKEN